MARETISCGKCGCELVKHPDESAHMLRFCRDCWLRIPASVLLLSLPPSPAAGGAR